MVSHIELNVQVQHNKEKRSSLANIKAMFDTSKKQEEKQQKKSPVHIYTYIYVAS